MSKKVGKIYYHPKEDTEFDLLMDMAIFSWEPVLEYLAETELKDLEHLEYDGDCIEFNAGKHIIKLEESRSPEDIKWIKAMDIFRIHQIMIQKYGGEQGILNADHVSSIVDRMKNSMIYGVDQLETIIHKAAFLMHSLLRYHPFVDGQKRTGLSSAFIFLGINGHTFWSRNPLDEIKYCINIAKGKYEVDEIVNWISNRVIPLSGPFEIKENPDVIPRILKYSVGGLRCRYCKSFISKDKIEGKCKRCGMDYRLSLHSSVITHFPHNHIETDFKIKVGNRKDNTNLK